MNPPDVDPESFNEIKHLLDEILAEQIPSRSQPSRFPMLNSLLTVEDIEEGKAHVEEHLKSSASGADKITYEKVLALDNELLCVFLNECIRTRQIPYMGLESCLLKFLTLLIHLRIYKVLEENNLLPASQNGFRSKFQTNNNAFILRTLIDKAMAEGDTLFVVFLDISNAFPSADHSFLWLRMQTLGLTGIYFD
ncbi:hypothetical protein K435DRAFT_580803, partial [Dendrothele bispora CBS 962.96]